MKKVIKNEIVSMEWNADLFFESKSAGFVAAINVYETPNGQVPVVFQENKIFTLLDEDTNAVASVSDIARVIKDCFNAQALIEDEFEDVYVEFGYGAVDDVGIAENFGLSDEDIADMDNRIKDLSGYWGVIEEDMC